MKQLLVIVVTLLALSGCDTPSPKFMGGTVHLVEVDGSRFRVFRENGGTAVEVHRISVEYLPSLVETLEKAYRAIEQTTGCRVVPGSLSGDQAIILAQADCP